MSRAERCRPPMKDAVAAYAQTTNAASRRNEPKDAIESVIDQ